MQHAKAPFLTSMLIAVLAPVFFVMATAFVTIPYSLGGHPGDARVPSQSLSVFHPT